MRAVFIYIGVALAILATFILVFKPEFATVSTPLLVGNDQNARIMGVTEGGDIYLSNNTVSNINTLFQGTNDSLKLLEKEVAALQKNSATKTALAQQVELFKEYRASAYKYYQLKSDMGDYLKNKDKVALGRTLGASQCGGDCRAVTSMWNPKNTAWNGKSAWQWNEPGSVLYNHATAGQIYLIRAT